MTDNSTADNKTEESYQYPAAFQHSVTELLVSIPRLARNAKAYEATCATENKSGQIQISFYLVENIEATEANENSAVLGQFLEFMKVSDVEGIFYHEESGLITFDNAGIISNFISVYIQENPDELSDEVLDEIHFKFESLIKEHLPELFYEGEQALGEILTDCKNPVSAMAFIDALFAIKSVFRGSDNLSTGYLEDLDSESLSLVLSCHKIEEQDYCDPDDLEVLSMMADDLSVCADGTSIKVKLSDDFETLSIVSPDILSMLKFIKKCYQQLEIKGAEDAYQSYHSITIANSRMNAEDLEGLIGEDVPQSARKANLNSLSRHFRIGAENFGKQLEELNPFNHVKFIPMSPFSSPSAVHLAQSVVYANSVNQSYEGIEARILQSLGMKQKLSSEQARYNYH